MNYPFYTVFGGRHFKAYYSPNHILSVTTPGVLGRAFIEWQTTADPQVYRPDFIGTVGKPEYADQLTDARTFDAAFAEAKQFLDAQTAQWMQPQRAEYATAEQKERIIRLLNHPSITRQEKTKTLLTLNRLSWQEADTLIVGLGLRTEETLPPYGIAGEAFFITPQAQVA